MDVAWPDNCHFTASKLVDAGQRLIAATLKMIVLARLFFAVHGLSELSIFRIICL